MSLKQSKAFAAFRASLITDKNYAILTELVPAFNAQCEDIRRKLEADLTTYHNQAKTDNFRKSLVYDLVLGRQKVLDQVQQEMQQRINERLKADGATVVEEIVRDPKKEGREKKVLTALFPDGSKARVPQALWIDYNVFDRV